MNLNSFLGLFPFHLSGLCEEKLEEENSYWASSYRVLRINWLCHELQLILVHAWTIFFSDVLREAWLVNCILDVSDMLT